MKTVLIIGSQGQLGRYLVKALSSLDIKLVEINRAQLDLTNSEQITVVLSECQPDLIINASAYTAVDKAEEEQQLAHQVNCIAPKIMAEYAGSQGIPFLHYSTDYVFSGEANQPYLESDPNQPQGIYGMTKLAGEQAVMASGAQAYIFRTAWVYSQQGKNFYKTMLQLTENRTELSIVNDQVGSPTYAGAIADASAIIIKRLLTGDEFSKGIYHMTCSGKTHWADFAKTIFSLNNLDIHVHGISTLDYPTPAKRPAYSVLDNQKLFNEFAVKLPSWESALEDCVKEQG